MAFLSIEQSVDWKASFFMLNVKQSFELFVLGGEIKEAPIVRGVKAVLLEI